MRSPIVSIAFEMDAAVSCVDCANFPTSWATTLKPRPASPALAASMDALSARSRVCFAIRSIRSRKIPTSAVECKSSSVMRACSSERVERASNVFSRRSIPVTALSTPSRVSDSISFEAMAISPIAIQDSERCESPSMILETPKAYRSMSDRVEDALVRISSAAFSWFLPTQNICCSCCERDSTAPRTTSSNTGAGFPFFIRLFTRTTLLSEAGTKRALLLLTGSLFSSCGHYESRKRSTVRGDQKHR